jgi:hypothetical protein
MQRSRFLLVLPGLLLSFSTPAAPDAAARAEIDHLLAHLEQSGCEFYRNGKWYPSPDARTHLDKKYQYLLKKGWVDTAEEFIARAATQSSRSGEAYQVRCPAAPAVPSAQWLRDELQRYRSRP